MQATHGFAVPGRRLIGLAVALVLVFAAFASTASAKPAPPKETYLALGDSLAFGYYTEKFNQSLPEVPAVEFEQGYANQYLMKALNPKVTGTVLVNNGCPEETTDSLIGNTKLAAGLGIAGEAPCKYHNLAAEELAAKHKPTPLPPGTFGKEGKFPLHHEYELGQSQLENALQVLGEQAAKGTPVTLITLNIGANDMLNLKKKCEKEAAPVAEAAYINAFFIEKRTDAESKAIAFQAGKEFVEKCIHEGADATIKHVGENVGRTLTVLRQWQTKFGGPFDYTGKIIFQGGYDPYGHLFNLNEEVLPGSNGLTAVLNTVLKSVSAKFGGCFANPQLGTGIAGSPKYRYAFNPVSKKEPQRLQEYTNMTNTTTTEFPAGSGEFLKNGPDIHPTVLGYGVMAKLMKFVCP